MTALSLCALALVLEPPLDNGPLRDKKKPKSVVMGTGDAHVDDAQVGFRASLSAGGFFSDLEVKQTPAGLVFTENSRPVKVFPEELNVEISTFILQFRGGTPESPERAKSILQTLRFDVKWKTGMETRPVASFQVGLHQPSDEEWEQSEDIKKLGRMGLTFPREVSWLFEIVVKDRDVPLTDSLLVEISAPDGKKLARFSAKL
jgi:hypothetical protein